MLNMLLITLCQVEELLSFIPPLAKVDVANIQNFRDKTSIFGLNFP